MIIHKARLLLFSLYLVIPALFGYLGNKVGHYLIQQQAIAQLAQQLPLAMMHIKGQTQVALTPYNQKLRDYLVVQNQYLATKDLNLKVLLKPSSEIIADPAPHDLLYQQGEIGLQINYQKASILPSRLLSMLLPALAGGLLFIVLASQNTRRRTELRQQSIDRKTSHHHNFQLLICLNTRTLSIAGNEMSVVLNNKPLCFYIALLNFCADKHDVFLTTHDELPRPFLADCHRYFSQLLAFGHNRRRAPEFNKGVDKSLSEIRAVLEQLMNNQNDLLKRFSPPRAEGLGSRAQRHNFALPSLSGQHYRIIK